MVQTTPIQETIDRLVANTNAVHFGQIEWDEFSRRNRGIWDEVHAHGDEFTDQVNMALSRVSWK